MANYVRIEIGLFFFPGPILNRLLPYFADCESDYDLPGPPLRIDDSPDLFNTSVTVTESFASSENVQYKTVLQVLNLLLVQYNPPGQRVRRVLLEAQRRAVQALRLPL